MSQTSSKHKLKPIQISYPKNGGPFLERTHQNMLIAFMNYYNSQERFESGELGEDEYKPWLRIACNMECCPPRRRKSSGAGGVEADFGTSSDTDSTENLTPGEEETEEREKDKYYPPEGYTGPIPFFPNRKSLEIPENAIAGYMDKDGKFHPAEFGDNLPPGCIIGYMDEHGQFHALFSLEEGVNLGIIQERNPSISPITGHTGLIELAPPPALVPRSRVQEKSAVEQAPDSAAGEEAGESEFSSGEQSAQESPQYSSGSKETSEESGSGFSGSGGSSEPTGSSGESPPKEISGEETIPRSGSSEEEEEEKESYIVVETMEEEDEDDYHQFSLDSEESGDEWDWDRRRSSGGKSSLTAEEDEEEEEEEESPEGLYSGDGVYYDKEGNVYVDSTVPVDRVRLGSMDDYGGFHEAQEGDTRSGFPFGWLDENEVFHRGVLLPTGQRFGFQGPDGVFVVAQPGAQIPAGMDIGFLNRNGEFHLCTDVMNAIAEQKAKKAQASASGVHRSKSKKEAAASAKARPKPLTLIPELPDDEDVGHARIVEVHAQVPEGTQLGYVDQDGVSHVITATDPLPVGVEPVMLKPDGEVVKPMSPTGYRKSMAVRMSMAPKKSLAFKKSLAPQVEHKKPLSPPDNQKPLLHPPPEHKKSLPPPHTEHKKSSLPPPEYKEVVDTQHEKDENIEAPSHQAELQKTTIEPETSHVLTPPKAQTPVKAQRTSLGATGEVIKPKSPEEHKHSKELKPKSPEERKQSKELKPKSPEERKQSKELKPKSPEEPHKPIHTKEKVEIVEVLPKHPSIPESLKPRMSKAIKKSPPASTENPLVEDPNEIIEVEIHDEAHRDSTGHSQVHTVLRRRQSIEAPKNAVQTAGGGLMWREGNERVTELPYYDASDLDKDGKPKLNKMRVRTIIANEAEAAGLPEAIHEYHEVVVSHGQPDTSSRTKKDKLVPPPTPLKNIPEAPTKILEVLAQVPEGTKLGYIDNQGLSHVLNPSEAQIPVGAEPAILTATGEVIKPKSPEEYKRIYTNEQNEVVKVPMNQAVPKPYKAKLMKAAPKKPAPASGQPVVDDLNEIVEVEIHDENDLDEHGQPKVKIVLRNRSSIEAPKDAIHTADGGLIWREGNEQVTELAYQDANDLDENGKPTLKRMRIRTLIPETPSTGEDTDNGGGSSGKKGKKGRFQRGQRQSRTDDDEEDDDEWSLRQAPLTEAERQRLIEFQRAAATQVAFDEGPTGSLDLGDVVRKSFRIYSHGGSVDIDPTRVTRPKSKTIMTKEASHTDLADN